MALWRSSTSVTFTYDFISSKDDTNTGINFPGADALGLVAGGSRKLLVNSVGVTINNGSLDVNGGDVLIADKIVHKDNTNTSIRFPSANTFAIETGNTERLRIGSAGQIGIAGANYGTSGQVITSQGASAAPQWASPAAGGSWEWVSGYDADAAAPGATGTVNFTGLSTAYSAYKVQVSHITFYGSGANRQDLLLAKVQSNGNWIGSSYDHRTLRYDGGGGPDVYGFTTTSLKLTAGTAANFVSGELTVPMMTRKDNSSYSTPGFYGDLQTHQNRVMFGCMCSNSDVKTYGFTGIQVLAESYGFYTGRIDLYRLKRS